VSLTPRARWRLRTDSGQVGGIDALAFGVLIFVLGTLVVANAWGVLDAKMAAGGAAREAARAFVTSPPSADPTARARSAAAASIQAVGRSPLVHVPLLGGFGEGLTVAARHSELVDPYRTGLPGEAGCAQG